MPKIVLNIIINAPIKVVFDLARSIDFHKESVKQTKEKAVAGKTSGLIGLGESVTWKAKHLGVWQKLESKITEFDFPNFFVDEMQKGIFKSFKHTHKFEMINVSKTKMIDVFDYKSPFGVLGKFADWLFLKKYMTNFILNRNLLIKNKAEKT